MRSTWLGVATLALVLPLGGCPPAQQNPGGQTVQLTAGQQAAVSAVVPQLDPFGAVLATLASLTDTQLDLDTINSFGLYGSCPQVTYISTAANVLIQLNFTTGCSNPETAGRTVSGSVDITVARATRTATVAFTNLVVNGHAITGSASLTDQSVTGGIQLSGTVDFTSADVGRVTGTITAQFTTTGVITLQTGNLSIVSGQTTYTATPAGLVLAPQANRNFVPQAGTLSFDVPAESGSGTVTLTVTFVTQSPVDGTVSVQVGSTGTAQFQVPGVP